jgi:hypothetical protein
VRTEVWVFCVKIRVIARLEWFFELNYSVQGVAKKKVTTKARLVFLMFEFFVLGDQVNFVEAHWSF